MKYPSSQIAVGCVYIARKCANLEKNWDSNLEGYTLYTES